VEASWSDWTDWEICVCADAERGETKRSRFCLNGLPGASEGCQGGIKEIAECDCTTTISPTVVQTILVQHNVEIIVPTTEADTTSIMTTTETKYTDISVSNEVPDINPISSLNQTAMDLIETETTENSVTQAEPVSLFESSGSGSGIGESGSGSSEIDRADEENGVTSETDIILESDEFDTEEPLLSLMDDATPKTLNADQYFGQEQTMSFVNNIEESTEVDDSTEETFSGSGFSGHFSGSADQSGDDFIKDKTIFDQSLDIMMSETEVLVEEKETDTTEIEENDLKEMLSSNNILTAESLLLKNDIEEKEGEENSLLDVDILEELGVVQLESDLE